MQRRWTSFQLPSRNRSTRPSVLVGGFQLSKTGDLRVFESGAITLYLADHYDMEGKVSYKSDIAEYYEMLSWVMFQIAGIGPMQGAPLVELAGLSQSQDRPNGSESWPLVYSSYSQRQYMDEMRRVYDDPEAGSPNQSAW
jgi:glutathione S-transferase